MYDCTQYISSDGCDDGVILPRLPIRPEAKLENNSYKGQGGEGEGRLKRGTAHSARTAGQGRVIPARVAVVRGPRRSLPPPLLLFLFSSPPLPTICTGA